MFYRKLIQFLEWIWLQTIDDREENLCGRNLLTLRGVSDLLDPLVRAIADLSNATKLEM